MNPYTAELTTLETETLDLIKFGVQERLASGIFRQDIRLYADLVTDSLAFALTAFVYGKRGQDVTRKVPVVEARFPKWLPRWLQRRWSRSRLIVLDASPYLVWPDAQRIPADFGAPVQLVHISTSDRYAA